MFAGIDEAGRGALAGPVIAAAVVFDAERHSIRGLDDSKRLTPERREQLLEVIIARARAWSVGRAESSEIDCVNVLQASLLAMKRAFHGLGMQPRWMQVDGNRYPLIACPGEAIVRGDAMVPAIMAASILAKVIRDREMRVLDALYPGYEFAIHKGYPTERHKARLRERGPCPAHRDTFGPVRMYRWRSSLPTIGS